MLTRIQHAAIVSENFVREAKFYESLFGMKRSKPGSAEEEKAIRTNYAVSISDGYVGVTVIGRKPGYVPGCIISASTSTTSKRPSHASKRNILTLPCSGGLPTVPSPLSAPTIPKETTST